MIVYHFVSAEHGLSDISLRRLRISRIADLNDPFELQAIRMGGMPVFRVTHKKWKAAMHEKIGLLCFSKNWIHPVLWSHYADRHRGMCLGLELSDLLKPKEISYTAERFLAEVNQPENPESWTNLIQPLLYTKYKHWEYEAEVRAYVQLDERAIEGGSYFYPFDEHLRLMSVFLGPQCQLRRERIQALVDPLYGAGAVTVNSTHLAYKLFTVVEDPPN